MKTLNLERVWELLNRITEVEDELFENDEYLYLLGSRNHYSGEMSFSSFLDYYSFKIVGDNLVIFNDDPVPWEDYSNDDFNYLPLILLEAGKEETEEWIKTKIEKERERIKRDKESERERDEQTFKMLKEKLGK